MNNAEYRTALMMYGAYVRDWLNFYDRELRDGMPVCFYEFLDNEYLDEEFMAYLVKRYIDVEEVEE